MSWAGREARWSCSTDTPRPGTCGARSCRCLPNVEYFRSFEQDAEDFARLGGARLAMPLLVLSGEKAGGTSLIEQARMIATNVCGEIVKDAGHWLMEEAPDVVIPAIRDFVA